MHGSFSDALVNSSISRMIITALAMMIEYRHKAKACNAAAGGGSVPPHHKASAQAAQRANAASQPAH